MDSFDSFFREYQDRFRAAIDAWDRRALEQIATEMAACRKRGGTVLIAGNGGSAAIANHTECDASKGTSRDGRPALNSRSLSANPSMITAIGNDIAFDAIFEKQLEFYMRPEDLVVVVSSSGKSPNVVRACRLAKARGVRTIALVGFSGGELKELADVVLHVAVNDYGVVEDMHQASFHLVTQWLARVFETS